MTWSGKWRIPEPRAGCPTSLRDDIDTVVVPGVAFTVAGARCGYGGGFYDSYLPKLRPDTSRVALAFERSSSTSCRAAPHDLRVDVVVTEHRVLRTAAR